ncbi:MAG: hypothetical protein IKC20_06730 [Clostridia bacterium]|nr:hypothetical protein [Clostridia bacterium]
MGTSVLLVFIIPLMFFEVGFSYLTGAIFGYPTTEIALPHDEEKGLVWEYDCVNDPNIELVKTKVENGEQIFVFKGTGKIDIAEIFIKDENEQQGSMMDIVFTDKNGNQKIYYGYNGNRTYAPVFYAAEDCQTIDITLTAQKARKNASWEVALNDGYVIMKKTTGGETENFTIIITPDNKDGTYATYGMFDVEFAYTNSRGKYLEEATAVFELQDGKHSLKSITYEDFWDKMFTDLKHILEAE